MDSSTCEPFTPLVETTTPLFSRTSRSLRPLHLTTTLMLVSSPPGTSISETALRFGVRCLTDPVGDDLPLNVGVAVWALFTPRRDVVVVGGRIVGTFLVVVVVPAKERWLGAAMLCRSKTTHARYAKQGRNVYIDVTGKKPACACVCICTSKCRQQARPIQG